MLMGRSSTFGRRYNLTGNQYFSDHGYVDTLAAVLGVDARKVPIPAGLMDQLWDRHAVLSDGATPAGADMAASASRTGDRVIRQRYVLAGLIPRIAPNLHRGTEASRFHRAALPGSDGAGVNFLTMAENTYEWFCRQPAAHRTGLTWEDLADLVAGQ
jgi:hypothetical protein